MKNQQNDWRNVVTRDTKKTRESDSRPAAGEKEAAEKRETRNSNVVDPLGEGRKRGEGDGCFVIEG